MTVGRPIAYYGSKHRLCPAIHGLIPPGPSTWVDLYCGSAIVTLSKPRHRREVINDLNDDVITLFEVLRSGGATELYRLLEMTPFSEGLLAQVYQQDPDPDPVRRAWQFLVMCWMARGGDIHKTGFRWSKGKTVAPELAWARLPQRLADVADRLRGVCIRKRDAVRIIDDYDTADCILFVDPPYPGPVGRHYRVKMTVEDHYALAARLVRATARVILTMYAETLYDAALAGWARHEVIVHTGANTFAPEVIFTNFSSADLPLFALPVAAE